MNPFTDDIRYLSIGTWRKNGVMVPTPVWFAPVNGSLYAFSAGSAGKVKRLRNSPRACVAHCDWRGTLLGEWHPAQAFLVTDEAERKAAFSALRQKYGWQMWTVDAGALLARTISSRAVIRIESVSN
jgi:PPOX class probable F420-dependent enzyme